MEFFLAFEVLAFCLGGQSNFSVAASFSGELSDSTKINIIYSQLRSSLVVFSNYNLDKLLLVKVLAYCFTS